MISFASFPTQTQNYGITKHHPDVQDDVNMDIVFDEEDLSSKRLTCPGEVLTSSQTFMR